MCHLLKDGEVCLQHLKQGIIKNWWENSGQIWAIRVTDTLFIQMLYHALIRVSCTDGVHGYLS